MATIKHTKVSSLPDTGSPDLIHASDWNADHTITGNVGKTKHKWFYHGTLATIAEADTDDLEIDESLTLKKVRARVKTAPAGASIIVKVYKNHSTEVASITISAGANRGEDDTLNVSFVDEDIISCAITQVGSTTAGEHLTLLCVFE